MLPYISMVCNAHQTWWSYTASKGNKSNTPVIISVPWYGPIFMQCLLVCFWLDLLQGYKRFKLLKIKFMLCTAIWCSTRKLTFIFDYADYNYWDIFPWLIWFPAIQMIEWNLVLEMYFCNSAIRCCIGRNECPNNGPVVQWCNKSLWCSKVMMDYGAP